MGRLQISVSMFLTAFIFVLITYASAIDAWFLMDDYKWIKEVTFDELISFFHQSWGHKTAYRPLMRVSFFIDQYLFGNYVIGWHLHSYIIHSANAALLFLLLYILSKNKVFSILTGLLFVIAPWGHDNIAWVSGRTYLLSCFFYLFSLIFCFLYLEKEKIHYVILSLLCFIFGLMSYEAVVTLPILLGVLLVSFKNKFNVKYRLIFQLVTMYSVTLIIFLLFRYIILDSMGEVNNNHAEYISGLLFNLGLLKSIFVTEYYTLFIAYITIFVVTLSIIYFHKKAITSHLLYLLSLIIIASVIYLPFSQIAGVAYRFLYMLQIPYIIIISYSLSILLSFENTKYNNIPVLSYLVILIFFILNINYSMNIAKEWEVAGKISKSIPEQVKILYPEENISINFIFQNIPSTYKRVGVFITYFQAAIKRQYSKFTGKVIRVERHLLEKENFVTNRIKKPAKYFWYVEQNQKIIELTEFQWEIINNLRVANKITKNNFDNEFYLKFYPDVGNHPHYAQQENGGWEHWINYGKDDKRFAIPKQ